MKAKDIMTSPVISTKKSSSSRDIAMQLVSVPFSGSPLQMMREELSETREA